MLYQANFWKSIVCFFKGHIPKIVLERYGTKYKKCIRCGGWLHRRIPVNDDWKY